MAKYRITPSSKAIIQLPISIGHKAEKGVEAIEFDLTAWVETYGSGTLTVIMRRWGDAIPYPIALEIDENNKATWTLSDTDTAKAGMAYAQLSYIVGDEVVKKSDIYTFRVMDSLTGEGEPPEAYESWLEQLTHLAAEAMAEVLDIEGIVTDKTLTIDGGIADGKATGDALALKADKSTTYTKTEVDALIDDVEVETDTTLTISGAAADAAETGRQIRLLKADLDDLEADIVPDSIKKALYVLLNASAYDESVYPSAGVSANLSAVRSWAGITAPVYQLESAFTSNGSNQLDTGFAFQDGHIYTICFDVVVSSANVGGAKAIFSNKPSGTSTKYSEMAIERKASSSTALVYWGYGLRYEDSLSDVYIGDRVRAVATVDVVNYTWEQTFKNVTKNVTKNFSRNGNLESIANSTNICLGATWGNRTPGFVGTVNDFKIYDRQFSSTEISSYLNEV